MIQANELKIGNWVYHNGVVINAQSITGKGISTDTYTLTGNRRLEDVSGILLNEEWLLKFGFENITGHVYIFNDFKADVFENDIMIRVRLQKDDYLYSSVEIKNIKYVHQLQNLYFALTSEELTL